MKNEGRFWDRLSRKYDEQVNSKYARTYDETIRIAENYLQESDVVLDYACGTGITTVALAGHVKQVDAIDISDQMIKCARQKSEQRGISNIAYTTANIFSGGLVEGAYDVVMAFNILHFLPNTDEVLRRIRALLKPGGVFLSATDCLGEKVTFPVALQSLLGKIGIFPHMRRFTVAALQNMIEANHFSVLEACNLYNDPPNHFIAARKQELQPES